MGGSVGGGAAWGGAGVGLGLAAGLLKLRLNPPALDPPGAPSSAMLAHPVVALRFPS